MTPRFLACALTAAVILAPGSGVARGTIAQGWLTTADGSAKLSPMRGIRQARSGDGSATVEVRVDTAQRYQTMVGFGASITDASAWLIQTRLKPQARAALLTELFSPTNGIGFNATRITIGASDFSRRHYSLADTPGQPAADLGAAEGELLPVLKAARAINPRLKIIATPWSAPAWMKDSGSLIKGSLKREHDGDFARYLVSYAQAMKRAGVPVDMLTIQNEPHFEPADYLGMRMEPARRAEFVGQHLGPLLQAEAPGVRLLDWDHNWDQPESPSAVLSDPKAAQFVAGVAWHCYAGDVKAQSEVHTRFPDKETWFTECSSGSWSPDWDKSFAWAVRTLVIGTTRNWAKGVVMWNVALDQDNGPHSGGCGTCRGLVTIDSRSGEIRREPEYYAFAHASRFVREGAVRVASDSRDAAIESVAFVHPGTRKATLIVRNGADSVRSLRVVQNKRAFVAAMPAGGVATFTWAAD